MNNSFINDLLIDPLTGGQLIFDNDSNTYKCSGSSSSYPVVGSVPQILIDDQSFVRSKIHKENNSIFNYIDHYQKDAILYDYSESQLPGVTRYELRRLRESIIMEVTSNMLVVLDVGCGNGWVSKRLIPKGKKVISMDISSINPANSVRDLPHENHAGLVADVFNIPIKDNSIDCIIASEVLEHVSDPQMFIVKLVKLLKDKGKLIITTPYNEKLEYFLCVHCNRPTPKSAHLHSFNEHNIELIIPHEGVKWSYKRFANNSLLRMRSHIFLKFLSFRLWILVDTLFNRIFGNPARLKIVIEKV
jgi:2-polyprenyl-3-methyl-5-hydroxy-6-metoxy-1,4-benzoquinol methylase